MSLTFHTYPIDVDFHRLVTFHLSRIDEDNAQSSTKKEDQPFCNACHSPYTVKHVFNRMLRLYTRQK